MLPGGDSLSCPALGNVSHLPAPRMFCWATGMGKGTKAQEGVGLFYSSRWEPGVVLRSGVSWQTLQVVVFPLGLTELFASCSRRACCGKGEDLQLPRAKFVL